MGMKPRLEDGPVDMPGLCNQAKKVGENAPMPANLVTQRKTEAAPLSNDNLANRSK